MSLILARSPGEKIRIGKDIVVTVLEIRGRVVRLGLEAPDPEVTIFRTELVGGAVNVTRQPRPEPDKGA